MAWCNKVCQISRIEPIPNSDRIEVAFIGEWPCVVQKHKYHAGDVIVYIMQDSVLPDNLIAEMGLTGKLAGPAKNRVKAIKLRGQRSVGLLYSARPEWPIGYDATADLGIVQYEPPIPIEMAGDCRPLPPDWRKYDVDHWNSNPTAFAEGESVIVSEKIDGSHLDVYITQTDLHVCSRSYSLIESDRNAFWRGLRASGLDINSIRASMLNSGIEYLYISGELVPTQELKYGHTDPFVYFYDIRDAGGWWDKSTALDFIDKHGGKSAPVLYNGPLPADIKAHIETYANGTEQVTGFNTHIREGVVISSGYGPERKQYKYISFEFMEKH